MDDLAPASSPRFLLRPTPVAIGHAARGRQMLDGLWLLGGARIEGNPFAQPDQPLTARMALHEFGWLDDFAALATPAARAAAQSHVFAWIAANPLPIPRTVEWLPEVAAMRLLRWLFHSGLILAGRSDTAPFHQHLHLHLSWISDHWAATPDGLPRLQSLAALFIGAACLQGGDLARLALLTLGEEAEVMGLDPLKASRAADDMLQALSLLVWSAQYAEEAGMDTHALDGPIAQLAQVLRALRHVDGTLPRFHGSGGGVPGRLDQMLARAPGPAVTVRGQPLGYLRMIRGRTSVILDAAAPPVATADRAHASTLGIEVTHARQPIIVSAGPGLRFGPNWAEAARRTHNHSALVLGGLSSGFFDIADGPDLLEGAEEVWAGDYDNAGEQIAEDCGPAHSAEPAHLLAGHDGWNLSYGLTCLRELWLRPDGLHLRGEDSLAALSEAARQRLRKALRGAGEATGIGFDIRFHLHPDLKLRRAGGRAILTLPDGAIWILEHDDSCEMRIEDSVWLDNAAAIPRPARQIVLTGLMDAQAVQIGWTLARSEVS